MSGTALPICSCGCVIGELSKELKFQRDGPFQRGMAYSPDKFSNAVGMGVAEKDDILLNSREAAELLDLSPDTVNELARKQTLPAVKRGRQWRFHRRDLSSLKKKMQARAAA